MKKSLVALVAALLFTGCSTTFATAATPVEVLQGASAAFMAAKTTVDNVKDAVEAEKASLAKQYICDDIKMKDWRREFGSVVNEYNAICSKRPVPVVPADARP